MPKITFPNRDRKARTPKPLPAPPPQRRSPDEYLRDLIRHRHPNTIRQAIAALPGPVLNRAWGELSSWECEQLWDICRSGRRSEP